jgi:NHL repeat
VATDQAGNVYVADPLNHRIQRFSSAGDFQFAWGKNVDNVAAGTGFEVCTMPVNCKGGDVGDEGGEFNFPSAVASDPAGNVYVGENTNNRVQKLDSAGNFQLALGKDVIDDGPGNTDFEICTAPATCKVGENGALGGEFVIPTAVAADNAGHMYVAEGNNRIQRFDSAGNFQRAWGKDVDNIAGGTGFEVCTLRANCKVGEQGGLGGEFGSIGGVATDARGHVYISDTNNNRVQRFDSAGGFQRTWGKDVVNDAPANTGFEICTAPLSCQGGGQAGLGGEFVLPAGLAADGPGNVYVADNFNDRVQKFTAGPPDPPASVPTGPTGPTATGQRARALKKCKKKRSKAARKKCRKRANRLPV